MRILWLILPAAVLILTAYLVLWPTPSQTFALPVEGKGTIRYTCTLTRDATEAKARAEAAHVAFQSRLATLASAVAEDLQAAMLMATATGDKTALEAVNAGYKAQVVALRDDLNAEFGCEVDSTLQPG